MNLLSVSIDLLILDSSRKWSPQDILDYGHTSPEEKPGWFPREIVGGQSAQPSYEEGALFL